MENTMAVEVKAKSQKGKKRRFSLTVIGETRTFTVAEYLIELGRVEPLSEVVKSHCEQAVADWLENVNKVISPARRRRTAC